MSRARSLWDVSYDFVTPASLYYVCILYLLFYESSLLKKLPIFFKHLLFCFQCLEIQKNYKEDIIFLVCGVVVRCVEEEAEVKCVILNVYCMQRFILLKP